MPEPIKWLTVDAKPGSEFWDRLYPGKLIDVGGHEFHTYRVLGIDEADQRIKVEEVNARQP